MFQPDEIMLRFRWEEMANMLHSRRFHAISVVDDSIFVFGGSGSDALLESVEKYNISANEWTLVASMPTARSYCAAAALNGLCYVIGGENQAWQPLNLVECYDSSTNAWKACKPMSSCRAFVVAVAYHRSGSFNWSF